MMMMIMMMTGKDLLTCWQLSRAADNAPSISLALTASPLPMLFIRPMHISK